MVVITGVDIGNNIVYTDNLWDVRAKNTYSDFMTNYEGTYNKTTIYLVK